MRSTVAILGTGLIGTSIGLALQRRPSVARPVEQARPLHRGTKVDVIGWDARPSNARAARKRGGIGAVATSMEEAVVGADTVVIAVPLDAALELAPRAIAAARPGALVLDVTPVKAPMLRAVKASLRKRPDVLYVSAHPMAGREKAGAAFAEAGLFVDRPFALVVPRSLTSMTSRHALRRAGAFARSLGARPITMTARAHDRAVAFASALPQLASIALALAVGSGGSAARALAGPGASDATRLAASPFSIWRPALMGNKKEITRCLSALRRAAAAVTAAARQADVRAMERLFSKAKAARKRVVGASSANHTATF